MSPTNFSIADIATGDGLRMQNKILQGRNENKESIWDWPLEQPSPKDFKEWRSAVSLLINEQSLLKYPVGRWLAQPHSKLIGYTLQRVIEVSARKEIITYRMIGVGQLQEQIKFLYDQNNKINQMVCCHTQQFRLLVIQ